MKLKLTTLLAGAALLSTLAPALATGLWPGLPIDGGSSYCAGYSVYNTGNTVPGTLPTPNQCNNTVPAGSATPTGFEYVPADSFGMNQATPDSGIAPATQGIAASALGGFGPQVVNTTDAAVTIPNNTPNYVVNVGFTTGHTITLPAAPQPWQIQRLSFATAPTNSVNIAANSGQTVVPASPTSGTSVAFYAWQYNPVTKVWYRIQ